MTTTRTIDITTPDGTADALLVTPDGHDRASSPGVVLYMDAFGLRPQIQQMAERLAGEGYTVLAPNTLYRGGPLELDGLSREDAIARVRPLMDQLDGEAAHRDNSAYLSALGQHATGPVGLTGYCMGGRLALRAAGAFPGIEAVGTFHTGGVVTDAPDSPHLAIDGIQAEVYVAHADEDGSMTPDDIAAEEKAFTDAGVTFTSELYEGAHHGFTMSDMPVYDAAADERHWTALLGLFGRTLKQD